MNHQDLKSFGLIPELIGRLPVLTYLDPLTVESLKRILTEPRNSLVKQYSTLFELEGITLTITDDALDVIAQKALEYKLGARGLRSICEAVLTDAMFDLPSNKEVKELVVDADYVNGKLTNSKLNKPQSGLINYLVMVWRYKGTVHYRGTDYAGWQRQKTENSVQEEIENALSTFCKEEVAIIGCGRTDSGVHARNYVFHFDVGTELTMREVKGINAILPQDIGIQALEKADQDFHARYHCVQRTYHYYLHTRKDPFLKDTSFFYPQAVIIDWNKVNEICDILKESGEYFPFCKSHSGVDHYRCSLTEANWEQVSPSRWIFTISANRFLRGMVRLIVGTCLYVGTSTIEVDDVRIALKKQQRLSKPWSVPAQGLFLDQVIYPD